MSPIYELRFSIYGIFRWSSSSVIAGAYTALAPVQCRDQHVTGKLLETDGFDTG